MYFLWLGEKRFIKLFLLCTDSAKTHILSKKNMNLTLIELNVEVEMKKKNGFQPRTVWTLDFSQGFLGKNQMLDLKNNKLNFKKNDEQCFGFLVPIELTSEYFESY